MVSESSAGGGAALPLRIHIVALAAGAFATAGAGLLFDSDAASQGMALISLLVLVGLQRHRGSSHPEESFDSDAGVAPAVWGGTALVLAVTIGVVWGLEIWLGPKAGAAALFVGVATAIDLPLRRHRRSSLAGGGHVEPGASSEPAKGTWVSNRPLRWLAMGLLLWGVFIGLVYVISSIAAPDGLLLGLVGVVLIAGCCLGLAWLHVHDRRRGSGRTS
jgi:hypothetical protein